MQMKLVFIRIWLIDEEVANSGLTTSCFHSVKRHIVNQTTRVALLFLHGASMYISRVKVMSSRNL